MQLTIASPTPKIGVEMPFEQNILHDRKIAILAADGFLESQLFAPKKVLEDAGAEVVIVSIHKGEIKAWDQDHWGKSIEVDSVLSDCHSDEFDGLLIPGGEKNPEMLLNDKHVADFIKDFVYDGKSVASICDGTKILLDTKVVKGTSVAAWPSLKKDVIQSGAKWKDDEVVVHRGIITSRCQGESDVFNRKMIEGFAIGPRSKKALLH